MDLPLFYQLQTLKKFFFSLNFTYSPTITLRGQVYAEHCYTVIIMNCRCSVLCSSSCTCFANFFTLILLDTLVYWEAVLKLT